jgi:hypothetical protein
MKKLTTRLSILFFVLVSFTSTAQNMRGFYVNGFDAILGNAAAETTLLNYTQSNGYNYLCLYSLGSLDLTSVTVKNKLASFISRAKTQYGVSQVGAAGEIYSFFGNYIIPYNASRTVATEKFDVLNFEFEFWIASSVANYYCAQYLTPNGYTCDSSGAFAFAKTQFTQIDQAAAANGLTSEVYFGWPNKGQMQWFAQRADRILLHAYRVSDSDIYSYTKNRLMDIASINLPVNVMIIFSSEAEFMGPWLGAHPITQPYATYAAALAAETASFANNIKLIGYQWFKYSTMPPTSLPISASITANGPVTFCTGGSVTLAVTSGTADSYQWTKNSGNISGATATTYNVNSSGDYAVKISKAGIIATSAAISVNASSSLPQPSITANGPLTFCPGGSVTLTSSSATGNRWSTNETTQSISVNTAGSYNVTVTSGGCSAASSPTAVAIAGSASMPEISADRSTKICPGTGVVLTATTAEVGGYVWSTGATTRSIVAQSAGNYWVRTGTSTCYAQSADKTVTMKSAPSTPSISAIGSLNLGSSGSVKLTSTSAHAYAWTTGSLKKSITVNTAGVYNVTVTGTNGCKTTSANTVVTSASCTPPPVPVVTSSSTTNLLEPGASLTLTASASGGYLWSGGQTTQSITVSTGGTYTVRSYNSGYCYSTSSPVTVYSASVLVRSYTPQPDEPGLVTLLSYPNPAHGDFTISFNSEKDEQCRLLVYDLSGKTVLTQTIPAEEGSNFISMNTASLAPGLYVARLAGASIHGQMRFMVQ